MRRLTPATLLTNAEGVDLARLFGLDAENNWQERAACASNAGDVWFPEKGGSTREAKKICTGCEVRAECLEYALDNEEHFGIWGGLSERERWRLSKTHQGRGEHECPFCGRRFLTVHGLAGHRGQAHPGQRVA